MNGQRGYTLAEVVVAMALFGLLAYASMAAAGNALEALARSQTVDDRLGDITHVRQQVLKLNDLTEVEEGGTVETPSGLRARWQAEVSPTNLLDVFQLELSIEFPYDEERRPPVEQALYVYRPRWTQAEQRRALINFKEELYERLEELREGQ